MNLRSAFYKLRNMAEGLAVSLGDADAGRETQMQDAHATRIREDDQLLKSYALQGKASRVYERLALPPDVNTVATLAQEGIGQGTTALHLVCSGGSTLGMGRAGDAVHDTTFTSVRGSRIDLANRANIVRALLAAGADPALRDGSGSCALHLAVRAGRIELVQALLRPPPGETHPQHWASRQLGVKNSRERTPLGELLDFECLVLFGRDLGLSILRALLGAGADPRQPSLLPGLVWGLDDRAPALAALRTDSAPPPREWRRSSERLHFERACGCRAVSSLLVDAMTLLSQCGYTPTDADDILLADKWGPRSPNESVRRLYHRGAPAAAGTAESSAPGEEAAPDSPLAAAILLHDALTRLTRMPLAPAAAVWPWLPTGEGEQWAPSVHASWRQVREVK